MNVSLTILIGFQSSNQLWLCQDGDIGLRLEDYYGLRKISLIKSTYGGDVREEVKTSPLLQRLRSSANASPVIPECNSMNVSSSQNIGRWIRVESRK